MKTAKFSNKEVIKYYSECGVKESNLSQFLWNLRALPSNFYQNYRIQQTKKLITKLGIRGKILDAACGAGYMLDVLPKGSVAVDINPLRVAEAKKRVPYVRVMQGDITKLSFPDNSFQAVIAAEIFEHIPDQQPLIKELWRMLKKGGLFICTVPSDNYLWKVRYLASPMYVTEPQCATFAVKDALNLFSKYSFEIVEMKKIAWGLNYLLVLRKNR